MCYQQQTHHEEQYKGHTIKIVDDPTPTDPYGDNDGMYPMIVQSGRNDERDYGDLEDQILAAVGQMDLAQLRTLADRLDGGDEAKTSAMEYTDDIEDDKQREQAMQDRLSDELAYLIRDLRGNDKLEALEAACDVLQWPCLNTCSRGYSQGDYADVLVAWTPTFEKTTGCAKEDALKDGMEQLETNVKVWAAWAWGGGAYGFQIEGPAGEDSCYGFLEPEPWPIEKTYVLAEARSAVDGMIESHEEKQHQNALKAAHRHAERVKQWIRSKVPMIYRQPLAY